MYNNNKQSYKIVKTSLKDDLVTLYLVNDLNERDKLSLLIDDYYEYKLKKDSLINSELFNELNQKERLLLAYRSALRRLAIKDHSIKQIQDSLKNKFDLNTNELNSIISKLINKGYLDDEKYTINRINYLKESLMSLKQIIFKLQKEGISNDLIDKHLIDDKDDELIKIQKKANKYLKTIKGRSVSAKKDTIINKLLTDGFNYEQVREVVSLLDFSNDILLEDDLLKLEIEKAYRKYSKKYQAYELKNRIYSSLASKGFPIEAIQKQLNEMEF